MWQIFFYEDHRGKSPVLEYLNDLPVKERVKANNALKLLAEFGTRLGLPHARCIQGRLWELRPGDHRLFYFLRMEKKFVILHAFRKQSMQTPEKEIATAKRRMNELLMENKMCPVSKTTFEDWQTKQRQDPDFVAAEHELEPGYQIARLRLLRGLTQAQLAEKVRTRQPSIARLENGSQVPSLSFLERIARVLDAKVEIRIVPRA
jgi:phage-related protein/DNA-binding XRE family transcriptional regulator